MKLLQSYRTQKCRGRDFLILRRSTSSVSVRESPASRWVPVAAQSLATKVAAARVERAIRDLKRSAFGTAPYRYAYARLGVLVERSCRYSRPPGDLYAYPL